jgi:hypothetical protein
MNDDPDRHQLLAAQVFALHAAILALIQSHPNPPAFLAALDGSSEAILSLLTPQLVAERCMDMYLEHIEQFRKMASLP